MILGGFPFPLDLRARAPRLKWFHQRPAGASNLRIGDLWGSDVTVTTSRGVGSTLAMAEYAIAGVLHFAKELDRAISDRATGKFDHRAYRPLLLEGKTVCGRRRRDRSRGRSAGRRPRHARDRHAASAGTGVAVADGVFAYVGGTDDLDRFLAESDFVVVCCQWTPETTDLINAARLAAMRPGSVLVNVARGEIVDEAALADALAARATARRGAGCVCG